MSFSLLLGPIFAITAAAAWGGADFNGGLATRRYSQYQVLALSGLSGLVTLLILAVAWREPWPPLPGVLLASGAGICGAFGLAALYRGLSMGNVAVVAPLASVVGALVPMFFELARGNPLLPLQWLGFALALAGIFLVAQSSSQSQPVRRESLLLALLAGVNFGVFFILLDQLERGSVFVPLVIARAIMILLASALMWLSKDPLPALFSSPPALLAGLLDAAGNTFYLLAIQYTRLDVAVVLSSLYPAMTVILSRLLLGEVITWRQWLGVFSCLVAVVMIVV